MKHRLYVNRDNIFQYLQVYIVELNEQGQPAQIMTAATFEPLQETQDVGRPVILTQGDAERLLADLVAAGVTLPKGLGAPAHVEAMQAHLGDLQKVLDRYLEKR